MTQHDSNGLPIWRQSSADDNDGRSPGGLGQQTNLDLHSMYRVPAPSSGPTASNTRSHHNVSITESSNIDDADKAAGLMPPHYQQIKNNVQTPPISMGGMSSHPSDLEFYDDMISEPVLVLGRDISHYSRKVQFMLCASGVFGFSLLYGYLQELISVQICNRQLGLFLAMMQFIGYTVLSFILRTYVYEKHQKKHKKQQEANAKVNSAFSISDIEVPTILYLGLSLLRAVDLGMTNMAMQYINYPAKTLMKSSRIVFTMIFGVVIAKKRYRFLDYFVVLCMVAGLAIFMHADATSSAIFQPLGVIMLTISLVCDGAISNMSENIMKQYGVGQDEFIFRMYSIALVAITAAAAVKGDLRLGMVWMMQPGTYDEMQQGVSAEEASWSVFGKFAVVVLFSSMGFFGSSCSAAITKNFGALTMSITSTVRKATTLFLSFFLFNNVCTAEHIVGVVIFIAALSAKSLRRSKDPRSRTTPRRNKSGDSNDLEMQLLLDHDQTITRNNSGGTSRARNTGHRSERRTESRSPSNQSYGTPGKRPNAGISLGKNSATMVL